MNLLNELSDSKFATRKKNIVNHQSNANYRVGNEIIYSLEVLKSELCDYKNAYTPVRSNITVIGRNYATEIAVTNCAPFIKCITKVDGTAIDDAKDLDLVMPMHNLLEYSSNFLKRPLVYDLI